MNKVLFIAYSFPPMGGAGVQRSLKFIKYLPSFDWQPIILTVSENTTKFTDNTLLREISPDCRIVRTKIPNLPSYIPWRFRNWLKRWFFTVDEQITWYPIAFTKALELIRRETITAIYTSSPPYTCHIIGYKLKLRTDLPWVADFRDPWVGNFSEDYPTPIHRNINIKLEKKVLDEANAIIVVSPPMRQSIIDRYPGQFDNKTYIIPNGYDPDDFLLKKSDHALRDIFTITYTGSFYKNKLTPESFLLGLKLAVDNKLIPRNKIKVNLVGNIGQYPLEIIKSLNLDDIVKSTDYVPHKESISYLLNSDVLLLIIAATPGSEAVYTGKIFEYLAAHKPILALTSPGAAFDLIESTQSGVVVPPDDISAISAQIADFYIKWENNNLQYNGVEPVIKNYERQILTKMLSEILHNKSHSE